MKGKSIQRDLPLTANPSPWTRPVYYLWQWFHCGRCNTFPSWGCYPYQGAEIWGVGCHKHFSLRNFSLFFWLLFSFFSASDFLLESVTKPQCRSRTVYQSLFKIRALSATDMTAFGSLLKRTRQIFGHSANVFICDWGVGPQPVTILMVQWLSTPTDRSLKLLIDKLDHESVTQFLLFSLYPQNGTLDIATAPPDGLI